MLIIILRNIRSQANQLTELLAHKRLYVEIELQSGNVGGGSAGNKSAAKLPKLPAFVDGKDDLDSYLQRFERFAKSNNWDESTWSTSLNALRDTNVANTLRDTGCSGVVVRKKFVKDNQYTGEYRYILLIDNTVRRVPTVNIQIDTPYLKGEVEAQCLPDALYDLIIGNVEGAWPPDDPDFDWHEACTVTTRAQAKRKDKLEPLRTSKSQRNCLLVRRTLVECSKKTLHL